MITKYYFKPFLPNIQKYYKIELFIFYFDNSNQTINIPIIKMNTVAQNIPTKKQQKTELAKHIKKHLLKNKSYFCRSVCIDGIYCYPVIYGNKYKIVNFESIHISCIVKKGNSSIKQKYSLLYQKYNTIEGALDLIEKVAATYKIYNGDLVSDESYKTFKLEESILPYTSEQTCCICAENTIDMTVCKHYICLHCREKCILNEQFDCPMCRKEEIINIYCIENNLINNSVYHILQYAFEYEYSKNNTAILVDFDDEPDTTSIGDVNEDDGVENDTTAIIDVNEEDDEDNETIEIMIDRMPDYTIREQLEEGEIDETDDVN